MRKSIETVILAAGLLLAAPSVALACPACLDMSAESRVAFAQTAVVLTLLPLGMVSGVGMWLRRRSRDQVVDPPVDE
jgi:hypothetical protein